MNVPFQPCSRCSRHVEGEICAECGKDRTSEQQYCDMCACMLYPSSIRDHNCLEKEPEAVHIRVVSPNARPRRSAEPQAFYCAECNEPVDERSHACFTQNPVEAHVVCNKCKRSLPHMQSAAHRCVRTCPSCYTDVLIAEYSAHACASSGSSARYCGKCSELASPGHDCTKLPNAKPGLCLYCNKKINDTYRDHGCLLGETYVEVRCGDCAAVRSVMMFRFHECEPVGMVRCDTCSTYVDYSAITYHECNTSKHVKDIRVKCPCGELLPYLHMHSHREICQVAKTPVYRYGGTTDYRGYSSSYYPQSGYGVYSNYNSPSSYSYNSPSSYSYNSPSSYSYNSPNYTHRNPAYRGQATHTHDYSDIPGHPSYNRNYDSEYRSRSARMRAEFDREEHYHTPKRNKKISFDDFTASQFTCKICSRRVAISTADRHSCRMLNIMCMAVCVECKAEVTMSSYAIKKHVCTLAPANDAASEYDAFSDQDTLVAPDELSASGSSSDDDNINRLFNSRKWSEDDSDDGAPIFY